MNQDDSPCLQCQSRMIATSRSFCFCRIDSGTMRDRLSQGGRSIERMEGDSIHSTTLPMYDHLIYTSTNTVKMMALIRFIIMCIFLSLVQPLVTRAIIYSFQGVFQVPHSIRVYDEAVRQQVLLLALSMCKSIRMSAETS